MSSEARPGAQTVSDPCVIARRIEGANAQGLTDHADVMNRLYPEVGAAAIPVAGGVASFVGADQPVSYAVGMGFDGSVNESDASQVVDFFRARGAVPRVDVCPLADESLLTALRKRGFGLCRFVNVLARPLTAEDEVPAVPEDIVVREALPADEDLWVQTADAGFSDGKPMTESGRRLATMIFHLPRSTKYLALLNGRIAGAATLLLYDGYAALAGGSVLPEWRTRGVHAALIRARLLRARKLGCDLAGIFAAPGSGSQRNAERHGFHVIYSKAVLTAE